MEADSESVNLSNQENSRAIADGRLGWAGSRVLARTKAPEFKRVLNFLKVSKTLYSEPYTLRKATESVSTTPRGEDVEP